MGRGKCQSQVKLKPQYKRDSTKKKKTKSEKIIRYVVKENRCQDIIIDFWNVWRMSTSERILNEARLPNIAKVTHNRNVGSMDLIKNV